MAQEQTTITASDSIDTPLGNMIAYASEKGICLLEFNNRKNFEKQGLNLGKMAVSDIREEKNPHIELLKKELSCYFEKGIKEFTVSIDMIGTDFQKKVWAQLLQIPYGKTVSYLEQAKAMGIPSGVRAVANANGANKIAIIIPCHRVIGTNKTLTGYAGGLERKRYLLDLESGEKRLFD